eukprot:CAMPEP_0197498462 /NCGR_PEP_ID=MMETSP1311-20131121/57817_1 /TAXON_ID=464262 /ORGANISM="Genus nov. species nov., Strain RCC856" /LENGTH=275 /DNA_ID=CAMNT_0043044163 /DNA_START=82 /DNA_END=909 /DNA_ORIENTATION=+
MVCRPALPVRRRGGLLRGQSAPAPASSRLPVAGGRRLVAARASEEDVFDAEDEVAKFMREQAARETGDEVEASVSYAGEEGLEAYGSEEVSDADVVAFTDDCIQLLKLLLKNRDMTLNEVKLILAIEDPRAQEARRRYGVETESGVSREEVAQCLVEVAEKEEVSNRIALRELRRELLEWPDLQPTAAGTASAAADASGEEYDSPGLQGGDLAKPAANPQVGRGGEGEGEGQGSGGLADLLPDWMGYGVLYSLSIVPIIITVGAVAVLWVNSFSG